MRPAGGALRRLGGGWRWCLSGISVSLTSFWMFDDEIVLRTVVVCFCWWWTENLLLLFASLILLMMNTSENFLFELSLMFWNSILFYFLLKLFLSPCGLFDVWWWKHILKTSLCCCFWMLFPFSLNAWIMMMRLLVSLFWVWYRFELFWLAGLLSGLLLGCYWFAWVCKQVCLVCLSL